MAYPKALAQSTIDKMFSTWDPKTVETLHRYYEAFSNLYGSIQLNDAWKVFKQFEPNIHKKQFIEFSLIARRENVPYYIYEIDEIYSAEKRIDTRRFIVNRNLILHERGKFMFLYKLEDFRYGKSYYAKPDFLAVSEHRIYDDKIKGFIENMKFSSGECAGKRFADAVFLTKTEKFDLEYYKSESRKNAVRKKANIPFSEKVMNRIIYGVEFVDNPIGYTIDFLTDNNYEFESLEEANKFIELLQELNNKSHLWRNCGYSPQELVNKYYPSDSFPMIEFGQGFKNAVADGDIDEAEFIRQILDMGFDLN